MKKIYIILPTYNDWKSLYKVLKILDSSLKKQKKEIYIIIVNDGSFSKFKKIKRFPNFKKITVLNLKKNIGSQKAIFIGLKFIQNKIKSSNNSIISILDSDGEDDPRTLKKLIKIAEEKKDFFIFASRRNRTKNILLKFLNKLRLYLTWIFTGRFINFGNFSSFPSSILKKIVFNNDIYLAFSSGVVKNYNKIFLYPVDKNKRYYGSSKVNFKFLLQHSLKIMSVFQKIVFLRSILILVILIVIINKLTINLIFTVLFLLFNLYLFFLNRLSKTKKKFNFFIKSISQY